MFALPLGLLVFAVAVGVGGWAVGWGQWASVPAGVLLLLAATFGADAVAVAARRPGRGRLVAMAESVRRALLGSHAAGSGY